MYFWNAGPQDAASFGHGRIPALSRRNEDKEARERTIFAECAEIAGLRVREGSAVSRPPPEPDILCEISGEGLVAFELWR